MKLIGGVEPTPQQMQRVQAIAHSLGIGNNDAMMPILIALDCYHGAFKELPEKAQAAADTAAKSAADRSATAVNEAVARAVSKLGPQVGDAIVKAANDINHVDRAKWVAGTVAVVAVVFGLLGWFTHATGYSAGLETGRADGYKQAADEKTAAVWANTPQGKLAFELAQTGSLEKLANCSGKGWVLSKMVCFPYTTLEAHDGDTKKSEYIHGWHVGKSASGSPEEKKQKRTDK
jgi:hypothetical protein